ncbi:hypothetical protein MferCBS31731_001335 [Microsporum ferrugineum]
MSLPLESQASNDAARATTIHRSSSDRRTEEISGASEGHTTWTQFLQEDYDQSLDSGENSRGGGREDGSASNRKRRLGSGSSSSGTDISRTGLDTAISSQPLSTRQSSRPGLIGAQRSGNPSFHRPDDETIETQPSGSPPSSSMSRQINSLRHRERSFTDHRLPRWQPDSEVTECPICGVTFTFWFRKHHCRKCGRVVCAACSPHRITIPQQFIVRPPEAQTQLSLSNIIQRNTAEREVISLIEDDETRPQPSSSQSRGHHRATSIHQNPRAAAALGGGTEVRLCNPCVPDPNPEPPRRYRASSSTSHHDHRARNNSLGWESHHNHSQADPHSLPSEYQNPGIWGTSVERSRRQIPSIPPDMEGRRRRDREFEATIRTHIREAQRSHRASLTEANFPSYGAFGYDVSSSLRGLPPRYLPGRDTESQIHGSPPLYPPDAFTQVSNRLNTHFPDLQTTQLDIQDSQRSHHYASYPRSHPTIRAADMNRPLPPPPNSRSHRIINERDLCPVCNHILPQPSSGGGEDAHEAHIRACIERHASRRPGASNQSSQSSIRPSSERLRMLTFLATEKDCLGTDGVQPECSICMEEYEVGAELARLECLCRFHKSCILGWFDRKEECPVHKVA